MKRTAQLTKKVLFSVKWQFMDPKKRYAYLWARTRKSWLQAPFAHDLNGRDTVVGG